MSGFSALVIMGLVIFAVIGLLVMSLARASKESGAELENAEAERRQLDAIKADQRRSKEIEDAADAARAAPAGDQPLAERLQSSGRGRKTRK